MPFVKLDCGILDSTLWLERAAREIFITALLMAEPKELTEPTAQIAIRSLDFTGWMVPPGWYGFVPAASVGIFHRAGIEDTPQARDALDSLGQPEASSRSAEYEGRRLVRVDGGFIVLNYIRYRDKDATTAERSRRWRQRQRDKAATTRHATPRTSRVTDTPTRVIRHQAEAEVQVLSEVNNKLATDGGVSTTSGDTRDETVRASFRRFWECYPKHTNEKAARKVWGLIAPNPAFEQRILAALERQKSESATFQDLQFVPSAERWLENGRWDDAIVPITSNGNGHHPAQFHDEPFECPHTPHCLNRHSCAIQSALASHTPSAAKEARR